MKNKEIKLLVLSVLLITSVYLYRRSKKSQETIVDNRTGVFEITSSDGSDKAAQMIFWIEDGKYWSQCKSETCGKKEISKKEYDKNQLTYLN